MHKVEIVTVNSAGMLKFLRMCCKHRSKLAFENNGVIQNRPLIDLNSPGN